VTPAAVLALAQSIPTLKLLDVGYCEQVTKIHLDIVHLEVFPEASFLSSP
jgi:hypothetical protein